MNIGLIGCSEIAEKAIMAPLAQTGFQAYGVASRDPAHAHAFAQKHHIEHCYESYEWLLKDPLVDAVYISLPNHLHAEWVSAALRAGKHVLCEKPICLTLPDFQMIEASLSDGLCLMEGIMTKYHRWQSAVYEMARNKKYGSPRSVHTEMNILPKPHFYTGYRSEAAGGGVFRDLCCYWLQFSQGFFSGNLTGLSGSSKFDGPNATDWDFHAYMRDDWMEYTFDAAYGSPYKTNHRIEFDHAVILVRDFFRASVGCYKIKMKIEETDSGAVHELSFEPEFYYESQLRAFEDSIRSGKMPEPLHMMEQRVELMEKIFSCALSKREKSNGT